mgnify:CR=1 FL=1
MIFNFGSGSSIGETLFVTAPAGVTVTASKDNKTKTKVVGDNGIATFVGLTAGTWTIAITDGVQTSLKTIKIDTGYSMTMAFFATSINVTYPEGSTCTCSDGATTLTAEDTSGNYTFNVPNVGTWTITVTDGTDTVTKSVEITADGQNESIELHYYTELINSASFVGRADTATTCTLPTEPDYKITLSAKYKDTVNQGNGLVETAVAHDLTNVDTVIFKFDEFVHDGNTTYPTTVYVSPTPITQYNDSHLDEKLPKYADISAPTTNADVIVGVSDLEGEYYIGVRLRSSWNPVHKNSCTISSIKLQ